MPPLASQRNRRIFRGGTKDEATMACSATLASHTASQRSVLGRPASALTCLASNRSRVNPWASNRKKGAFQ
jgi:hypothetical protein